jgi:glycerol-3-phosphate cytidylyltransferase
MSSKNKVIYTAGAFDILNEGHINLLQGAKSFGDYLIAGISTNKLIKSYKNINPIMTLKERSKIVNSLKFVDKVIIQSSFFDTNQLRKYNIDVIVIGSDWKNKTFLELDNAVKELKCKLIYLPYTQSTSSSNIKKRIIKHAYEIIETQTKRT